MAVPPEIHIHIHVDPTGGTEAILAQLQEMKATMSQMDSTLTALFDRVNVDVAELRRQLAEKDALLVEAQANDATDAAAIADLTARNDALNADIAATLARMEAYDVDPSFPPVAPPEG